MELMENWFLSQITDKIRLFQLLSQLKALHYPDLWKLTPCFCYCASSISLFNFFFEFQSVCEFLVSSTSELVIMGDFYKHGYSGLYFTNIPEFLIWFRLCRLCANQFTFKYRIFAESDLVFLIILVSVAFQLISCASNPLSNSLVSICLDCCQSLFIGSKFSGHCHSKNLQVTAYHTPIEFFALAIY